MDAPDSMPGDGRPLPNSYRVGDVPLYAGEYPFALDAGEGRVRLGRCLDAGIRTFIDLTTPADLLEPYQETLAQLAAERGLAVRYHRVQVADMDVPSSPAVMRHVLDLIDAELGEGRAVYFHCWGGVGRTGTVAGCHLVRQGLSGPDALDRVGRLFATMSPSKVEKHRATGAPQTPRQRDYVLNWLESPADLPQ